MGGQKQIQNAFGRMEQTFIASSTLKRNKRYLDIEKINCEEENSQIKRRRPLAASRSIEAKINRSFSNSTAAITQRLDKDISRFKSRFNSQQRPSTAQSFYVLSTKNFTSSQIKGLGIAQQLSRDDFYKVKSKSVLDERLFNNFYLETPDEKHTCDLRRGPERDFDNSLKHINDIEYNTQSLHQKYFFKSTTMDCRFHYKKQKEQPRSFFIPPRPQNKPATDLSFEDVEKAAETVRNKPKIDSFYMNSGRELPCQFEQRTGTALTSHWRNKNGKIDRPEVQYTVRSMKQKLFDKRRQSISASKRPKFKRNQVCDKKFFIIGKHS